MKQLIIQPRRSGKTTFLLEKRKDIFPDWQYICVNVIQAAELKKEYNTLSKFITIGDCCNQLQNDYVNYKQTTFLLDEYFLYPKKEREYITKYLINNNCSFIAIGTSDRLHNRDLINQIRLCRSQRGSLEWNYILKSEKQLEEDFGASIVYNLLSYPEVEIIEWRDELKNRLSPEQYKVEILGKLYG